MHAVLLETFKAGEHLQSSLITFDQANEVLNLSKESLVKLRALISQYPIKSIPSLSMRDQLCETTIQHCDRKIKAILALPVIDRSSLICLQSADIGGLDAVHFERSVINMYSSAGAELTLNRTEPSLE